MTYGLKVTNGNDYIQIDSDSPRLCSIYNGTYSATSSRVAVIVFPKPITTEEPPCIFIRNSPSRPNDLYDEMVLTGTSGSWTGFRISAANSTWRPSGKWFASVFSSLAAEDYGLRLWSASGEILYDSGAAPVIFTRANSNWKYAGRVVLPGYGSTQNYINASPATTLLEDEYFMINPLSRGVLANGSTWDYMGARFNYTTGKLEMFIRTITQGGAWTDQGMPAGVFARLPGS